MAVKNSKARASTQHPHKPAVHLPTSPSDLIRTFISENIHRKLCLSCLSRARLAVAVSLMHYRHPVFPWPCIQSEQHSAHRSEPPTIAQSSILPAEPYAGAIAGMAQCPSLRPTILAGVAEEHNYALLAAFCCTLLRQHPQPFLVIRGAALMPRHVHSSWYRAHFLPVQQREL